MDETLQLVQFFDILPTRISLCRSLLDVCGEAATDDGCRHKSELGQPVLWFFNPESSRAQKEIIKPQAPQ